MQVANDAFVTVEYTLTNDDGEVVDATQPDKPLSFIFGKGQLIPGFEKNITGKDAGQKVEFSLEAADAYGETREELYSELPRKNFPDDMEIEKGMVLQAMGPMGPMRFRVDEVKDDVVVADFNHPLAGQRLHFDVKIAEVREATQEEIDALAACAEHECTSCGKH
jgi:FKBP-type peptidyl-prolyl cis-trans isomerase SlyD